MLILKILSLEPAHGYGIAQRVQQVSRDAVQLNQGSLYPGLASSRAEALAESGMAPVGNRPGGEVLFADARRRTATGARERDVGSPDRRPCS